LYPSNLFRLIIPNLHMTSGTKDILFTNDTIHQLFIFHSRALVSDSNFLESKCTVGNRVNESQGFCFHIFYSSVSTLLWSQISRNLLGFRSAYIYSFESFLSQLFSNISDKFVSSVVFTLEVEI
jgi:hypothetical protein